MITIEPDLLSLTLHWLEKETKGLGQLEPPRERNTLGLSALIATHTYIPSLAEKKGKADVTGNALHLQKHPGWNE